MIVGSVEASLRSAFGDRLDTWLLDAVAAMIDTALFVPELADACEALSVDL